MKVYVLYESGDDACIVGVTSSEELADRWIAADRHHEAAVCEVDEDNKDIENLLLGETK